LKERKREREKERKREREKERKREKLLKLVAPIFIFFSLFLFSLLFPL
jgi:cell division septal protein FtsQ